MRVLLVASESHPFIKTGGLGEVIGALPKELKKKDIDIRVVIPKYKKICCNFESKMKFNKWFVVPVGWRQQYCGIFEYNYSNVTYYFLDNEYYFDRDELYGYYDDAERFAFFNRASLGAIKELGWRPDIIHCNDWQTGMIPVLLKLEYTNDEFYKNIKTIYSIHNILFQGVFTPEILPELFGYDMRAYENGSIEFDKGVSFMKGGINYSDMISTVSDTYADEIKSYRNGQGLDGLLREKNDSLKGILNGIDYEEYNPYKDPYIFKQYDEDILEDKIINKENLQHELLLPIKRDIPMIGIISRLTNQKGIDLIVNIADRLLQKDVQLVILGTGDKHYEEHFNNLQSRYKDRVSVNIKFDDILAHKIYAGCDMFIMPSLFEPCGLGQLIALRYGTVPIVRETGGLKDTIYPYNKYNGVGNGFSFKNFKSNELLMTIEHALEIFQDKDKWRSIILQAMSSDNSWEKSANEYIELYQTALTK